MMKRIGEQHTKISEPSFYHTTIKEWPEGERPREKVMLRGVAALSEAELLAILIRTGIKGVTAVDLARRLLSERRTLRDVAGMSVHEFQNFGIAKSKAIALIASFELARRLSASNESDRLSIQSPEEVIKLLSSYMRDLKHEEFWALLLNATNILISKVRITIGILNSSLAHPRECFVEAIMQRAASIIFVHNHPSGNPEPSKDDIEITHQLVQAGKILGIAVQDHIILAGNSYISFAERNILQ